MPGGAPGEASKVGEKVSHAAGQPETRSERATCLEEERERSTRARRGRPFPHRGEWQLGFLEEACHVMEQNARTDKTRRKGA